MFSLFRSLPLHIILHFNFFSPSRALPKYGCGLQELICLGFYCMNDFFPFSGEVEKSGLRNTKFDFRWENSQKSTETLIYPSHLVFVNTENLWTWDENRKLLNALLPAHTKKKRALEPSATEESRSQQKNSKYKENVEGEKDKVSVVPLKGNRTIRDGNRTTRHATN